MKSWWERFNIYLVILALAVAAGCQTDKKAKAGQEKKDKEATLLRLFLEVNPDGTDRNGPVTLLRFSPVTINVSRTPFLTEADLDRAALLEQLGVPMIQLQFKMPEAAHMLEMITASYKGQRIAVFGQFPTPRWLAAPQITKRLADGLFTFTPDASKEEAERIVRGLNNVAAELKKKS